MQNIQNLLNISKGLSWGGKYVWVKGDFAYGFDGTDDYITSGIIGKTSYDMSVNGNCYTWTDLFGDYININWNRNWWAATGTLAALWGSTGSTGITTPVFTQATSFSIKVRVQPTSIPAASGSGFYGSINDACIWINSSWNAQFTIRGSSTVTYNGPVLSINTLYDLHLVYDSAAAKFYCYVDSVLQNVGGTSGPATFTTDARSIWDGAMGSGSFYSSSKAVYHACTRNVALNQAEVTADNALWNTAKSDSRIVQYYIPANLAYNSQYLSNPKQLDNASRTKVGTASVTADTTVAPDGTTTADTVTLLAVGDRVEQLETTATGSVLASRTFIMKAFVKVAAGTWVFRLWLNHNWVTSSNSSDFTATTDRQEFTFSVTNTSSTLGTGMLGRVQLGSGWVPVTLLVRNVRMFLSNEVIRDEAPNIWGTIWWKTPVVLSAWTKIGSDSSNAADVNSILMVPRFYFHQRNSINEFIARSDTTISAIQANAWALGAWFRWKCHIVAHKYFNGTTCTIKIYKNWDLIQTGTISSSIRPPTTQYGTAARAGRKGGNYYTWNSRDLRCYISTPSFSDTDARLIYLGSEPVNATKYFNRKPLIWEAWTTAVDRSGNASTWTLTNGVTRVIV